MVMAIGTSETFCGAPVALVVTGSPKASSKAP
jgi:hypothetical protein